uniref:Retrotransposon protein, putative, Ty1-copia subclass n=1 Tax=Tanacetum cinerariifolium TaxID=118510 RepID=A0A6L2K9P6_TANCI|nr:retrotransposon protein, putative, Ty1-copia subclass [Tanacetum cinerariifolium]
MKGKRKVEYLAPKAGIMKQKFQGTCYNCDQPGHRTANCKMPKRVYPCQDNMVNDNMDMIAMVSDIISMISEVNLVGSNNSGWWVDIEATRHVCADKSIFYSFRAVDNEEKLYMGTSATADIKGEGDVILKMTSEKELKLTNVLRDLKSLPTKGGNEYFIAFIDDCTKYCYVYLLKSKDETIDKFVLYKTEVENQLGRKIKVVRNDRGGEYMSLFAELCAKHGIRHEFTIHLSKTRQRDDNDLHDGRQDQLEEEEVEPQRSNRARTKKSFRPDFVSFMVENEPTYYREAMKADGTIDKYKARLVIKGYRQCEGLDYFDAYSPVTGITSIRMVLAIATLRNLEVHQMDVKKAFLNRDLEEEIYMNQLEGFIAPGQEIKMIKSTNGMLKSKFDMKDMGLADVILRIKIIRTHNEVVLSQAHYVDKNFNTHNVRDFGLARTPIDTSMHLSSNKGVAMTRVLHYLRYSRDYRLHYDRHPAVIKGYTNANWISDIKDSRSTSGYVFTLDKCEEEAKWLRQFVEDIPRWPKLVTVVSIHCDSQSAIGRAHSTMYNGKFRHIRRRHNSIRQLLSTRVISIDYVKSKDNITDPLMKGLSKELVSKSSKGMKLKPLKE